MANETAWAFFEKWAKNNNINQSTWANWRCRGIPHWARPYIILAAQGSRKRIPLEAYDEKPAREGNGK